MICTRSTALRPFQRRFDHTPRGKSGVIWLLGFCLLLGISRWDASQSLAAWSEDALQLEEAGNDVRAWLEHVNEFLKEKQWTDAVETLRRVMENRGDQMIATAVDPQWQTLGFTSFIPVREYCQMQLAAWHWQTPEALDVYRQQVDPLAKRLFDEAVADGSEAKLQRIVDEMLLSSFGDQAALRLGEMALERGNYALARRSWESIHPQLRVSAEAARVLQCSTGRSWWSALRGRDWHSQWPALAATFQGTPRDVRWLVCPDSDIPVAAVLSRLVLASVLEGSLNRARLEAELLGRLDPNERGTLGGNSGTWVELVNRVVADASTWPTPPRLEGWPAFAGTPARNGVASAGVDVALRPIWRFPLPLLDDPENLLSERQVRVAESSSALLSYHVAVANGVVYVAEPDAIHAVRLRDGQPMGTAADPTDRESAKDASVLYRLDSRPAEFIPGRSAHVGVARCCVTIDAGRLFARLGAAWTGGAQAPVRESFRSSLVGIDLTTQKLLFDRILPGAPGWEFESAPLASGTQLFATLRRRDPSSAQVKIASYDVSSGRLLWERIVGRSNAIGNVLFELVNSPLSLADDTLYYNSNLGAVVALRANDGGVRWVCRYPRSELGVPDGEPYPRNLFRDLTPCLVDRGTVYVAAADSERLFALDVEFGQVQWSTSAGLAVDVVHLLGVAGDRLIGSGDCLYWLDAATGAVLGQFPGSSGSAVGQAMSQPRGFGRGLLAGSEVYWPTRDRMYVFGTDTGRQLRQPVELGTLGVQGGNLVICDGVLLIATPNELVAFNASGRVEPPAEGGVPEGGTPGTE
jgi:outer membrane protein assembly factor BamB